MIPNPTEHLKTLQVKTTLQEIKSIETIVQKKIIKN